MELREVNIGSPPNLYTGVRGLAIKILNRVDRTDAYLDKLLEIEIKHSELASRDKALLFEIVHGVVRWLGRIDWILNGFYKGQFSKCIPNVKNSMRVALYQILFLDKVPDHAAVNESVEFVKKLQGEKSANLTNAVLRNIIRNRNGIRYPNKEEFKKLLSNMGLTESDVQAQIERGMAIQQLIDKEVTEKIMVSDEETRSFYDKNPQLFQQPEQVKARHILIKVQADAPDDQKAEARKKIEAVQQKVKKGEDFATLAKTYSEGPSGPRGGDLGYFRRGQMVKPFEEVAFSLKPDQTSEIVETRFGYHLIKVDDKKPAKKMTYAEVKDRRNDHLKKQKATSEADAYIETLRKDAKIEKSL